MTLILVQSLNHWQEVSAVWVTESMNKPSCFCSNVCPHPPRSAPPLLRWVRWKEKCDTRWAKRQKASFSKTSWIDVVWRGRGGTWGGCKAFHLGLASSHSVIPLPQFLQSSSSSPLLPQISQILNKEGLGGWVASCFKKPSFCFPPWSGIRRAGAEDPGRCPGPVGSSSGLHRNPAGQPRGTASCPRSWSPETRRHAAPTRSQRWAYPVRSVKSVKISLTRNVCLFVVSLWQKYEFLPTALCC